MTESPEHRLKRLAMRAHRRGIKEMDVILGLFAEERLASLDGAGLDAFEALLDEADHDLYQWVSGQVPPPAEHAALIAEIARVAEAAARG